MSGEPTEKRGRPDDPDAGRSDPAGPVRGGAGDRAPIKVPPGIIPGDEDRRERSAAARYAGVGLQFAAAIIVSLLLGRWLDRRFGTDPLFLYLGVFLGAGGAFYSMYRRLMADLKREEEAKRARRARQGTPGRGGEP